MHTETTREALIRIITEQQIDTGNAKLRIGVIAKMAGITRQAFHRYYGDLKPYVLGEKPISTFFDDSSEGINSTHLLNAQKKIGELQSSLSKVEATHKKELQEFKDSCVTSLMKSDLALHDADNVRKRHAQQISHNEKLRQDLSTLKLALLHEQSRAATAEAELNNIQLNASRAQPTIRNLIVIDEFDLFNKKNIIEDESTFIQLKNKCAEKTINKINTIVDQNTSIVTLYIDRFISRFEKFADQYNQNDTSAAILVRFPIFDQYLIKSYLVQLDIRARVQIILPVCDVESIIKTQRAFFVRNVPHFELKNADDFGLQDISLKRCRTMGITAVLFNQISQGD
ncbi:hypothetical protein [Pseudomonas sp. GM48]|uniref:hypothetical protein n=1 Tax=Pseudomonas sp. GM48 TaxID=1144330 RepID=UPI00026FDDBD|nr:hypothetical protein [Pseudomonas sp. GM48]EJM56177.1 hypothetical protein PMI28_03158 [Pseudomonas sp. GM48]